MFLLICIINKWYEYYFGWTMPSRFVFFLFCFVFVWHKIIATKREKGNGTHIFIVLSFVMPIPKADLIQKKNSCKSGEASCKSMYFRFPQAWQNIRFIVNVTNHGKPSIKESGDLNSIRGNYDEIKGWRVMFLG